MSKAPANPELLAAAHKTVEAFNGIINRRIWLKDGKISKTDGHEIIVPFTDPDFYLLVERQLSHILFRSDAKARDQFVKAVLRQLQAAAQAAKVNLGALDAANEVLSRVIDVLESHRVGSLWGLIYPGSYDRSRARLQKERQHLRSRAHDTFFDLMLCLEAGLDIPAGDLDRFRPAFETALQRVERRGFAATLTLARWLVMQLVNELLQEDVDVVGKTGSEYRTVPGQKERSDPRARALAFQSLVSQFGVMEPAIAGHYNDYTIAPKKGDVAYDETKKATQQALGLDMMDEGALEQVLQDSEERMQAVLDAVQKQLSRTYDRDAWVQRDFHAKINFVDVLPTDLAPYPTLNVLQPEDAITIRRLRSMFFNVQGRRTTRLEDTGTAVNVPALIERRITRQAVPCFLSQTSGRGFQALILIDRSGSMELSGRIRQAERATKIITEALDFPFVTLSVWGFQSLYAGEVTITRFDPELESFQTDKSPVEGYTPLHIALRLAVRDLAEGTDVKQLFVVTDGAPMYDMANGKGVPGKQLQRFIHEDVRFARRQGVNVIALLIGDIHEGKLRFEVDAKDSTFMFGSPRFWKCVDESRFGENLIRVIASSFCNYLSSN